jgi:uncharacterized protein YndB with AHSA1/START domain
MRKNPEHRGRTIRTSVSIKASPADVWEAWADPETLAQWFPDRAEGRVEEGATQTWYFDRFKYALPYEVYSAVPGEHLVYTGEPPGRPRFFLQIEITREGGSTIVTLANSGFLDKDGWDDEYEGIASGWQIVLATLKLYVERFYGRARSQFFAVQPVAFDYHDLMPYYRQADLLRTWLTTDGSIGQAGSRYDLVLQDGIRASGEVLTVTGWEVLLSWNEIDGALALKGFSIGPDTRAICVHGMGWGLPQQKAAEFEMRFQGALERLARALKPAAASAVRSVRLQADQKSG